MLQRTTTHHPFPRVLRHSKRSCCDMGFMVHSTSSQNSGHHAISFSHVTVRRTPFGRAASHHHITTQHSTTQHNAAQHSTAQHITSHHITPCHMTSHDTTRHDKTRHDMTRHDMTLSLPRLGSWEVAAQNCEVWKQHFNTFLVFCCQ